MREAEQQKRPFVGLEIRNIIAADTDIKDVLLASKSAKNLQCHRENSKGGSLMTLLSSKRRNNYRLVVK